MLHNFNVTLTGVDSNTDIKRLFALSKQYPFVEWGVLYSPTRCESGIEHRYPSRKWIYDFVDEIITSRIDLNVAFHLCGKAVAEFVKRTDDSSWMYNLVQELRLTQTDIGVRYQLNFNKKFMDFTEQQLVNCVKEEFDTVITAHNKTNASISSLPFPENHHVLYDGSGGRGIGPVNWKPPIANKFCGYAGGLGPDNVVQELEKILKFFPTLAEMPLFWLDMETKIRNMDDWLDLNKCEAVLKAVEPYIREV